PRSSPSAPSSGARSAKSRCARSPSRRDRAMKIFAARAVIVLVLVAAWEAAARWANPLLSAPPSFVAPALVGVLRLDTYPELPRHLLVTAREIALAYGLAVLAGLGSGFALGLYRTLGRAYGPILAALYAVPAVVWYPSLMLFFGLDSASKIA